MVAIFLILMSSLAFGWKLDPDFNDDIIWTKQSSLIVLENAASDAQAEDTCQNIVGEGLANSNFVFVPDLVRQTYEEWRRSDLRENPMRFICSLSIQIINV